MEMSRKELQGLAILKKEDARLLFEYCRYCNAYYLYGYAVEIALKACISKQFCAETIPDKKTVQQIYTHKITDLVVLAGLKKQLADQRENDAFDSHWQEIELWSEESRYVFIDPVRSHAMHQAVQDEENGAFQWITKHW
jgi:hypothetical protein